MQITVLTALGDNYVYVLTRGGESAVVDPSQAGPVLSEVKRKGLTVAAVLLTHHHADHVGGVPELQRETGCLAIGPDDRRLPDVDRVVGDGDELEVIGTSVRIMAVPGHTRSHLAYYFPDVGVVFTGDALFVAGCGRILEETPAAMWQSLCALAALPEATAVYCGHEYTAENLEFAAHMVPDDRDVRRKLDAVRTRPGQPTVPSTIGEERRTNVFLRADEPSVRQALGMSTDRAAAEVFAELRRCKDAW